MKKRVKSEENLQLARDSPCLVCKRRPPSEVHHLKTRASNGGDEIENIIPVCRMDHVKIHQYGLSKMVGLSESLKKALIEKGWVYEDHRGRWRRNLETDT